MMIFFGWGRNSRTHQVSADQALVLSFSYVHVFWLFRLSYGLKYAVATLTDQGWAMRPLAAQEATAIDAPSQVSLHWWWRWGLLIGLAVIVVLVIGSILATP